jgi:hypothetical protein
MSTMCLGMLLGLPHLEMAGWGGIYRPHTNLTVGEKLLLSAAHRTVRWGHQTVRCPCPVRLAVGLTPQVTVGVVDFYTGQSVCHTRQLKGKCALGPFLSILVIKCQHKCLNVNQCPWMNKVQIFNKGMFLSLSTLVLCTNIFV